MAKSVAPLILGLGAAVLLLGGKKKKSGKKLDGNTTDPTKPDFRPNWNEIHRPETVLLKSGWDQWLEENPQAANAKMVFSEDCSEFVQEISPDEHNNYITMMFHHLVENMPHHDLSIDNIAMAIIKDQAPNCPWGEKSAWTELMTGVYDQLRQGVAEYAASFG